MLSLTPGTPGSGVVLAARPKRTGSLALFYRKMYQLAYVRIRDLCERLELDTDFVQKYVCLGVVGVLTVEICSIALTLTQA